MALIKAAVARASGAPFSIEELELRAPEGREVEVAVDAVAICHSDIIYADGGWHTDLPAVFGHEAAGRVVATGPGAADIEIGTPVIATLIRACGTCRCCAQGQPTICENAKTGRTPLCDGSGQPVAQPLEIGGFAERTVVDRSQIAPVPGSMAPQVAALLACGVVTGVGAVVNAGALRAGEDAVVIGAGGVGLNAVQGARIAGARRVVAVDIAPQKIEAARAFGATDGVLADGPNPWAEVERILGRKADAVFVTVGAIAAYQSAQNYIGSGGRVVMVGMPPAAGAAMYLEPDGVASAGQRLIGSKMGDVVLARDIPWLVDLYAQGRLKLDELVSRSWALDEINAALDDTRAGAALRNVILPGG